MKITFYKNLFRDIGKTISRFLSIVVIIAIGVAFYAGVRATSPDMKISGDLYLDKNNFMDYKLISTMGLTKDDIAEVAKQPGISKVEGTYSIDAVIEKDEHELVVNVNALPENNGINLPRLVEGRLPENSSEAIVEKRFLESQKLKIGDEIELKSGKEGSLLDNLKNTRFKIVGTAQSAMYISAQRQLSSVGSGTVRGFVYILPEVFKSEVYTEMYVKLSNSASLSSLEKNDEYKKAVSGIEANLKELGRVRSKVRYEDIMKTALGKINDAEAKLEKSRKEAADKIADGYRKLDDAKAELAKGEAELSQNQKLFDKKMADGRKQLADGKKQLEEAQKKLDAGKQQVAGNISTSIGLKVEQAKKLMESDPANPAYTAQYNMLAQLYENCIKGKDFDNMYSALQAQGALPQLQNFFDITALKQQFDKGAAEIELNKKKLAASDTQLQKAETEGRQKLADARKKLDDGQQKITENTEKLKTEEDKANKAIADGEAEIRKNRDKLNDIKEPMWYVLGRSANVGYETYRLDSDRISNIGKVFPLIFFLVAALVSLTTMTRLVQENRTEIGTLKALGYSGPKIVSHYLVYSLSASLAGSLAGISFAFKLFPSLIMSAYRSLYTIPVMVTPFNTDLAFQASLLAILFTTAAAVAATIGELREVPASLMRPKPPKSGKTIFLEKIGFIWKRLSFTNKVTARNLFRYKQRLLMTVIGVAACTGLMLTGFGLKAGITGATERQFNVIYKYNLLAAFDKNLAESEIGSIRDTVMKDANTETIMFAYNKNGSVKIGDTGSQDAYIVVPENAAEFEKYVSLTMKGRDLKLGNDGVILTEKLSKLAGKKAGDTVEITLKDKTYTAKVAAVTEHYLQHYIYMSPDYYRKLTGETLEFNEFYGLLKDTSENAENGISKTLAGIKSIGSVSYRNNIYIDSSKSMDSVNSVVLILIISAAALAFVVIYNLTNININERKRELATIKLLGFYDNELALYIYRENIVLTVIGSLLGILLGVLMTSYVLETAETNIMLFMKVVQPLNILYSVTLTIIFSVIVNLVMQGEFKKIDMIESLKSAE